MTDRKVRERAYAIWEEEGRIAGREAEHWARAQAEVQGEARGVETQGAEPARTTKKAAKPAGVKADAAGTASAGTKPAKPASAEKAAPKKAKADKPADAAKAGAAKKTRGDTSRGSLH